MADRDLEHFLRVTVKEREFTVPIILDTQKEWGEVTLTLRQSSIYNASDIFQTPQKRIIFGFFNLSSRGFLVNEPYPNTVKNFLNVSFRSHCQWPPQQHLQRAVPVRALTLGDLWCRRRALVSTSLLVSLPAPRSRAGCLTVFIKRSSSS